ncbi:MAG: hypothetical protein QOG58_3083 [Caballeronia sp.]|jgi:hypothetical protein|nr:hypothetical protein [Caballeronia sp.]
MHTPGEPTFRSFNAVTAAEEVAKNSMTILLGSVAVRKAGRAEAIYKVPLMKEKSRTAERLLARSVGQRPGRAWL